MSSFGKYLSGLTLSSMPNSSKSGCSLFLGFQNNLFRWLSLQLLWCAFYGSHPVSRWIHWFREFLPFNFFARASNSVSSFQGIGGQTSSKAPFQVYRWCRWPRRSPWRTLFYHRLVRLCGYRNMFKRSNSIGVSRRSHSFLASPSSARTDCVPEPSRSNRSRMDLVGLNLTTCLNREGVDRPLLW